MISLLVENVVFKIYLAAPASAFGRSGAHYAIRSSLCQIHSPSELSESGAEVNTSTLKPKSNRFLPLILRKLSKF